MNVREITGQVARLGALPYFPSDDDARIAIAEVLSQCAADIEQVQWTVKRCLQIWDKWEGPHELRAVLCSKFPPADGIDAYSRLPQFDSGIPSELEARNTALLGPAPARQLTGDMDAPDFPRDAAGLIAQAVHRTASSLEYRKAMTPTTEEIERIKAQQDNHRPVPGTK